MNQSKDDNKMRRCSDCPEHSGVTAELEAGRGCMKRLEKGLEELRAEFSEHLKSSSKGTIAILVGIMMLLLGTVANFYKDSPKDKYSSQAEATMLAKAIGAAIREAKK